MGGIQRGKKFLFAKMQDAALFLFGFGGPLPMVLRAAPSSVRRHHVLVTGCGVGD